MKLLEYFDPYTKLENGGEFRDIFIDNSRRLEQDPKTIDKITSINWRNTMNNIKFRSIR